MRSIKEIMQEMGFNKDAPTETQKAFIKHLIAAANQTSLPTVADKKPERHEKPVQLEFDLSPTKDESGDRKRVS